ncbi:MAG TPA: hypothetical protein VFU23_12260 [Gemmatimonadales bacterium]|nr:hypothetical protein [Gemmatimonadales bacterium]
MTLRAWWATTLLVTGSAPAPVQAQEVWQADVRVQTLEVNRINGNLIARVVVYSDNDDEARAVHVEIMLPVGVGVMRTAAGCQASPSPAGVSVLRARVICEVGNLPVGASKEVFVMTTVPPTSSSKTFGVFVLSDTPDPRPGNNYAEKVLP